MPARQALLSGVVAKESGAQPPPPAAAPAPLDLLHLSSVVGAPLEDGSGEKLGRVVDLIVRLGGDSPYPPVSGAVANVGGRELFVPVEAVESISEDGIRTTAGAATLGRDRFERRRGEVLLAKDLAGRHVIHLRGARLVRANEIELACLDGQWKVIGVDTTSRPVRRRLLPRTLRSRVKPGPLTDWTQIEPFVAHVPTARLRIPFRKLAKLHPAQIADLVEAASHDEGEEIIQSLGQDRELEADVFEELDLEHQIEFLRSRSDAEAARVLAKMGPDDAADLITELDQDRRLSVLQALPARVQGKVRKLLTYSPETAGGLMNPEYLEVPSSSTPAQALAAVRASELPPEALGVVFVTDEDGRLVGTASLAHLVRADAKAPLAEVAKPDPIALHPDADLHGIVRKMSDFNLAVIPVTDADGRMLGQITVDDVLELLLPAGWRRQYGMSAPD